MKDALAAGFDKHLAKPVLYADLLAAVEELTAETEGPRLQADLVAS